jgi:hypothetical protein
VLLQIRLPIAASWVVLPGPVLGPSPEFAAEDPLIRGDK